MRKKAKTIGESRWRRLAFINSRDLPQLVNYEGVRYRWVGIGWVDEGKPKGWETKVVPDRKRK